jgi:GNAT superfamily N-acetyltransferase
MTFQIREFVPDDYPACAAVANAVFPEYPGTAEELRFEDERRPDYCRFQRWVVESCGEVVGTANYGQWADRYHPRRFTIDLQVRPHWQGRGLGKALYARLLAALRPADPLALLASAREDMERPVRFLTDRGFREMQRAWESRLDVAAFDPSPYAGVEEKSRSRGIEIRTLRQLESDPARDAKLHELHWVLEQDVPATEAPTRTTLEHFRASHLGNPNLLPDGYFIAVDGDELVGLSALWGSQGSSDVYTGLTGVRREYRRQGIALALKLRAITYARQRGHPVIKTWNEVGNRAMLSINERLGYVKQPAWIEYVNENVDV